MRAFKSTITRAENGYILSEINKEWDGQHEVVTLFPTANGIEYKTLQSLLTAVFGDKYEITVKPKFPPLQLASSNGRPLGRMEE